ncbi:hypothetical protein AGDE_14542 [Angomonas deanei]|uniref:Uncharacterized protein n=1 Tax=Angomonas deanei TaxID=59799 RepID=A0A7G2CBG9_9TRYP|nr:hypothetical protein AGDE_14542 [Angomonas deanei]CAD2216421.1 hypothetical protein, conserved [Angomonas deanei]|eukprot:EPY20676.1 hypothetical protein AGDE_14542 [Angomonas deanei]
MEKAEMTAMRDLGGYEGLTLDGFLLLNSSGCDNPEDVESVTLQKMNLTDSVRDDLAFFQTCFFWTSVRTNFD